MSLTESYHFVAYDDLPQIAGKTSLSETYKLLDDRGAGSFILADDTGPAYFVKAVELGEFVLRRSRQNPDWDYGDQEVRAVVREALERQPVVPIWPNPVDENLTESSLTDADPAAFQIVSKGERAGWFLNHEHVREAKTKRPRYRCTGGHDTFDPDSGKCWCGKELNSA